MNTFYSREQRPGASLLDAPSLSSQARDNLFYVLILTMLFVYSMGNLLLLSFPAFLTSSKLLLVSACSVTILYSLAAISNRITFAAFGLYLLLSVPLLANRSSLPWLFWTLFAASALLIAQKKLITPKLPTSKHLWASSLSAIAIIGSQHYTTFDLSQRIVSGNVHKDTLFHASISSMLKHYGVASTGLHGLVNTPYHTLSHTLFASLSTLSDVSTLDTYGSASQILFAPLLIFFLSYLIKVLDIGEQVSPPLCWSLVSTLLVVVPALLSRWCFWDSYFISESYLVSMGIFSVALIPLFCAAVMPFYIFSLPILVYLMTSAKASVGAVYVLLWLARIVFVQGKPFDRSLLMLALVSLGAYLGLASAASSNSEFIFIGPLHFIKTYSFWGESIPLSAKNFLAGHLPPTSTTFMSMAAVITFLVLHYLPSWIVILCEMRALGFKNFFLAPAPLYVTAATAAGLFFGLLFEIPGGSAYYFTNVSFFVCIPFLTLYTNKAIIRFSQSETHLQAIAFALVLTLSRSGITEASIASSVHRHSGTSNRFINSLVQIRDTSSLSSMYIAKPKDLNANPVSDCAARPFVYPAVSEHAWLEVIPKNPECFYQYYGYRQYGISAQGQTTSVSPVLPVGSEVLEWRLAD
jgi:hypothetical protein